MELSLEPLSVLSEGPSARAQSDVVDTDTTTRPSTVVRPRLALSLSLTHSGATSGGSESRLPGLARGRGSRLTSRAVLLNPVSLSFLIYKMGVIIRFTGW